MNIVQTHKHLDDSRWQIMLELVTRHNLLCIGFESNVVNRNPLVDGWENCIIFLYIDEKTCNFPFNGWKLMINIWSNCHKQGKNNERLTHYEWWELSRCSIFSIVFFCVRFVIVDIRSIVLHFIGFCPWHHIVKSCTFYCLKI